MRLIGGHSYLNLMVWSTFVRLEMRSFLLDQSLFSFYCIINLVCFTMAKVRCVFNMAKVRCVFTMAKVRCAFKMAKVRCVFTITRVRCVAFAFGGLPLALDLEIIDKLLLGG